MSHPFRGARRPALRLSWVLAAVLVGATLVPGTALADDPPFQTSEDPYITLAVPGQVTAILSSGESIGDFTFQGLPDGIGIAPGPRRGTATVLVAHEETTIPFFGSADFQNASVSRLVIDTTTNEVLDASVAVSPDENYLRFCSAAMAGPDEGFDRYIFFTGEETDDWINRDTGHGISNPDWQALDPKPEGYEQAGLVVAHDVASGQTRALYGMGRLNHENTVAVPGGWNRTVMLTTDDTFNGPSAQLFMYLANRPRNVWEDKGTLWAFQVTGTQDGRVRPFDSFNGANDYLDLHPGDDWTGRFIRVPPGVALGDQSVLEEWSNDNNVFQFIRLEDIAYDKNHPRTVYVADTGRSRVVPDPVTGRAMRGPSGTVGLADNGSVFKMVLNAANPKVVDSFSVLAQGDDPFGADYVPFVSPDNLDTSANSLMVQEDTDEAAIWHHDFASGNWAVAATVNDPDGESSGIVDASKWFGEGSWLVDVQGHGRNVVEFTDEDGILRKLESGQLMLMTIPGS